MGGGKSAMGIDITQGWQEEDSEFVDMSSRPESTAKELYDFV